MTSATFAFVGNHPAAALTTIYQHIDGDLSGAATYLRAMLALDYGNEYAATNFLRGNLAAGLDMGSIVTGHDVYPSTSFCYTLNGDSILAEQRLIDFEPEFKTVFSGSLVDFLNSQPGVMLHHVALYGRLGYYTLEKLEEEYDKALTVVITEFLASGLELGSQLAATSGNPYARERVEELQSLVEAAYLLEEPDAVLAR